MKATWVFMPGAWVASVIIWFLGGARICGTGGDVLAQTGTGPGLAVTSIDVAAKVAHARRAMSPIRDLRPDAYRVAEPLSV